MKTSLPDGTLSNCACHWALLFATSGRSCSEARNVFFMAVAQLARPCVEGRCPERTIHAGGEFRQRGVWRRGDKLLDPFPALGGEQAFSSAEVGLGFRGSALLVTQPDTTDGHLTEAKTRCDLCRRPALPVTNQRIVIRSRRGTGIIFIPSNLL